MDELKIDYDYLIEEKEKLNNFEKQLKKLLKKIEKLEEKLVENEEDTKIKNNIKKLSKEKIELKKAIKEQKNKYNDLVKEASDIYFKDITLSEAKENFSSICGALSTRGERRFNKFTYYFSGRCYDYKKSIIYYLACAYGVNRMISTNKYLNKYLKFPEEIIKKVDVIGDLYECYFSINNCSNVLSYIKRFVL